MKRVICFLVICLFTVFNAAAQNNIFFKKDNPKYSSFSKKVEPHKKEQPQLPSAISLYATSLLVKRPFSFNIPKQHVPGDSRDAILYIIGLSSSILGSIYADKLHYNYSGDLMYPTVNYRQNPH